MITPMFSNLLPRYIDSNWYQLDKATDEDAILAALEKEHENTINEIIQKDTDQSSTNQEQFEEEEDANDDDSEAIESDDEDDEMMEEGDQDPWVLFFCFNYYS